MLRRPLWTLTKVNRDSGRSMDGLVCSGFLSASKGECEGGGWVVSGVFETQKMPGLASSPELDGCIHQGPSHTQV